MRYRKLAFVLAFVPVLVWAQAPPDSSSRCQFERSSSSRCQFERSSSSRCQFERSRERERERELGPGVEGMNAPTRAVLLANCPKAMAEADWLRLMAKPVNRSLYPLRITQAMLDTLDVKELDPRYQYVLVREQRKTVNGEW